MFCSLLGDEQIQRIHQASLDILERVGVVVPHQDMLGRLEDAGAAVDWQAQRARLPGECVEHLVARAGRSFTLYGRDLAHAADFGRGKRNINSAAGEAYWVDEPGGNRRYASLRDVETASRFADALPNVQIVGAMSDPHELPVATRCIEVLAAQIRHTTKPVTFWYHNRAAARFINEILIALRGSEERASAYPLCYPFLEPISPLRFPHDGIDLLYETSRLNLPVPVGPMAQMGMSAPMSLAGTMAQENAEILAGIVMTQLIRPGMPVCYGGICHAFDMQTTQLVFSGPEQALFSVAMTQMGKHYGLPVYINAGLTDAKRPDAQAGLEAGITLAWGAAAGADIFGHAGISGVDQASSLDMLVLQNEIVGYVERTFRPVDVSDDALGLDLIEEVGPGGSFIDSAHTVRRFRSELWFPQLLDRRFYEAWRNDSASSLEERCARRKAEILANHRVEPVDADLDKALTGIVQAARRELLP